MPQMHPQIRKVLEAMAALNQPPIEAMTPAAARRVDGSQRQGAQG
jgi:hypothetical protein